MKENTVVSFSLRNVSIKFLLVSLKGMHAGSGAVGGKGRGGGDQPSKATGSEETY